MHPGLSLLVVLTLGALDDSGPAALFDRVKPSVVGLRLPTLNGKYLPMGTAWVARPDGLLVTNSKLVALSYQMEAVFDDGRVLPIEGVIADDPEHDLAVLKVEATHLVPLPLGSLIPPDGTSVYIVGNPFADQVKYGEAQVAAYLPDGLPKEQQEGAPDTHALLQLEMVSASTGGSPVLDEAGRVIRAREQGTEALTVAAPAEYVRMLLGGEKLSKAGDAAPVPWLNVVGSVLALVVGIGFFRSLRRGPSGSNRPVRKWSGYEE